jgi:hypothetical protein
MGPGEVAWDVDRCNLPQGEELAAVLSYVPRVNSPSTRGRREMMSRPRLENLARLASVLGPGLTGDR